MIGKLTFILIALVLIVNCASNSESDLRSQISGINSEVLNKKAKLNQFPVIKVKVEETSIKIPISEGFFDLKIKSPKEYTNYKQQIDESLSLLAILGHETVGATDAETRAFILSFNGLNRLITDETSAYVWSRVRERYTNNSQRSKSAVKEMFENSKKSIKLALPEDWEIRQSGRPYFHGVFREIDNSISVMDSIQLDVSNGSNSFVITVLVARSMLLVKNKLLLTQLVVSYSENNLIELYQQVSNDWTDAILDAN